MRTKHHDQWIKEFHRYVGDYVAHKLKNTPIKPLHLTYFRFLCGIIASLIISLNMEHMSLLVAAIFIYLFSMLDAADGSLARIKKISSLSGGWLDRQFDGLGFFFIFLGIGIRFAQNHPHGEYWSLLSMSVLGLALILKVTNISYRNKYRPAFRTYEIEKVPEKVVIQKQIPLKQIIKNQIDHDFHTISTIIIFGLITNQLHLLMALTFIYLFLWWLRKNFIIAKKARLYDSLKKIKDN
tara:strand:+ start:678 stop:1394 length:717 start_codon:yes stop_codon:yes gene_type:complete